MAQLVRIREAIALEGRRLRLTLTNGSVVERDVSELLVGPVFEPVHENDALFRRVRVEEGSVVWPNGADLCPDVLIWGGLPPAETDGAGQVTSAASSPPEPGVSSS